MNVHDAVLKLNDAQRRSLLGDLDELACYVTTATAADVALGLRQLAGQSEDNRRRIEAAVRRVRGDRGPIDVTIVAVEEETASDVRRLQALLGQRQAQVRRVRVVSPAHCEPGPSIVVLGTAVGGEEGARRVAQRLDEGALGLRRWPPAPEDYARYAEDLRWSAPLVPRCRDLVTLRPAVVAWLDEQVPRGAESLARWEEDYLLRQLPGWIGGMHTALVNRTDRTPLRRAHLYVALPVERATAWRDKEGKLRTETRGKRGPPELGREEDTQPVYVDELVSLPDHRFSLLLGEAGSGKTVTAMHLAAAWAAPHVAGSLGAEDAAGLAAVEAASRLLQPPRLLPLVPLFVEARRLDTAEALLRGIPGFEGDPHALLGADRYVLVVDSLDEVPTLARRREVLAELVSVAARGTRVVLTSRPGAHTRLDVPATCRVLPLAALDDDTRGEMVARWARAQGYDEARSAELFRAVHELSGRFDAGADAPLVANPLLLTCIFLVYQEGKGRLPDNAADLYRRMVDILCDLRAPQPDEARARPDDPEGRRHDSAQVRYAHASALAWAMQQRGVAVPLDRLAADLKAEPSLGFADLAQARARIEQLVATTAIFRTVEEDGVELVRPWHRSFQEYLAAARFAREAGEVDRRMATLSPRLGDPAWRGCLGFVFGALGQVQPDHAQAAARAWLATEDADPRVAGARLAILAEAVAEYRPECFDGQDALLAALSRIGLQRFALDGTQWAWRDRVGLLEALGRLELDGRWRDPTVDAGGWVRVPAYRGTLGGDGDAWRSLPAHAVDLPELRMFARPVVVADYARFVDEGGYDDATLWDQRIALSQHFEGQRRYPNRPVTSVSWFEAMAFARWATRRWCLPGAGVVDLPTSAEWEQAARSSGGTAFPWGDRIHAGDDAEANYHWGESPRRPTAVGAFPGGDVEAGGGTLHDLAGNVWEWTRTAWGEGGVEQDVVPLTIVTSAPRVLRGGAWNLPSRYLRCAARLWYLPQVRNPRLGFRVVFRPSSPVDP